MKHAFFYTLIILISISCNLIIKNDEVLLPQYKHLKDKTISNFEVLNSYKDSSINYARSEKPLVVCYVETGCTKCVLELKQWNDFIKNNNLFSEVDFLVIAYGEKDFYFDYHLKTKKYFNFDVFIDINQDFLSKNNIGDIIVVKTLLLDQNNRAVFYGSPIIFPELKKSFLISVNNLLQNN